MPCARGLEKLEELTLLLIREIAHGDIVGLLHRLVDALERGEALLRDVAEHLASVRRRPLSSRQTCPFELVEQARDARRLVDHAVADDESWKPFLARTTEDPQDVVLLRRHSRARDDLRKMALDERRRSQNADRNFRLHGMKRPTLSNLRLETARLVR